MSNVDTKVITIGRAADNTVVLDTANVSAHHARLTVSPNRIVLEDLKSTNGTSVRTVENKTMRAIVNSEDSIFLGSAEYSIAEILQLAEQSPSPQRPPSQTPTPTATPEVPRASAFPNAIIAICAATIAVAVLWLALPGDEQAPANTAATSVGESTESPTEDAIESHDRGIQNSEPQTPAGDDATENSQAGSDTVEVSSSTKGQQETGAPFDATQAMFVVYCRQAETRTPFRVGTAFAIDDGRVVTSASVIYSLRTLMQNSFTEPTLYSPTQKHSFEVIDMHGHPEFESLTVQIDALRSVSDNEEKMVSLLNQRIAFDIGTMQTKEPLPVGLKAQIKDPRPGQKLRVVGYPFDVDDPFFDASLTLQTEQMDVRSDPLQFPDGLPSAAFSARVDGNRTDQTNLAFIGSPILDASNLVVGIYVRQTPGSENIERFDGSLISQLAEGIPE